MAQTSRRDSTERPKLPSGEERRTAGGNLERRSVDVVGKESASDGVKAPPGIWQDVAASKSALTFIRQFARFFANLPALLRGDSRYSRMTETRLDGSPALDFNRKLRLS